jgi:leucyl aminopeptidase
MDILLQKGGIMDHDYDAVIIPCFEDDPHKPDAMILIDRKCGGIVTAVTAAGDFTGKLHEIIVLYTGHLLPAKRIILAGLGKRPDYDLDRLRGVFAKASQQVRRLNQKNVAVSTDALPSDFTLDKTIEAAVEGVFLGLYQFTHFKTLERNKIKELDRFTLVCADKGEVEKAKTAVKAAEIISRAVYFVRDLVSMPANEMTPADMANEAINMTGRKNVKVTVLDAARMQDLGMNALLGVARGSGEPPKFIIVEYGGGKKNDPRVVLVGKGITFDSGGISLKPADKMDEMKTDMAGGAAVLGAIMAVSDLNLPINVTALIPATENLPGGKALKPGDIIKSMSGQTIEVINTDAEGRLILADALTYAVRLKPALIIDLATLTGACIVALGKNVIGMMGNDDALKTEIKDAAVATGEKVWELPLWEEYHDALKSDVADFKNVGNRDGGAITAAAFLSKFAGNHPWVHLDIAGPAWLDKDRPYIPKGASGVGVRLLVDFLRKRPLQKK